MGLALTGISVLAGRTERAAVDYRQEVGKRIRVAREAKGLSQGDVGSAIGVTKATISNWENGVYAIPDDQLARVAEVLGTTSATLQDSPESPHETDQVHETLKSILVRVPRLGSIPAGKFTTEVIMSSQAEDFTSVPASDLRGVRHPYALKVDGTSMEIAGIHKGDTVIINPEAAVLDGGIYVVRMDGDVSLKRIYREPGKLRLANGNGVMIVVPPAQVESLGEVIAFGHWETLRRA